VVLPGQTYDEYTARGEDENRNREFTCDLTMASLGEYRSLANYFRLGEGKPCTCPGGSLAGKVLNNPG
jgi:hypothetical protein